MKGSIKRGLIVFHVANYKKVGRLANYFCKRIFAATQQERWFGLKAAATHPAPRPLAPSPGSDFLQEGGAETVQSWRVQVPRQGGAVLRAGFGDAAQLAGRAG